MVSFSMALQRFSCAALFLGQLVVLLPALLFLSISSFHLNLKSEIGSDNKLPHVISSGHLGISSVNGKTQEWNTNMQDLVWPCVAVAVVGKLYLHPACPWHMSRFA